MAPELNIEVVASPPIDLDLRWYEEIRDALLLRVVKGAARVLDGGCGDGEVLLSLAEVIGYGLGVDRSSSDVGKARMNAGGRSIGNVEFALADATALPADDNSYEIALCLGDVLGYSNLYGRWRQALLEMSRVLRPGGMAVIHCMNWTWEYRTSPAWTFFARDATGAFEFVRARRTPSQETCRSYAVIEGTPLYEWVSKQEWPVSPSGYQTSLDVCEKRSIPKQWLRYGGTSRHHRFTAVGLRRALRSAGFDDVWVTPFGATYDIACDADLLEILEPVRRRLAHAEARVIWKQRTGSGPWLFAAARKPRST